MDMRRSVHLILILILGLSGCVVSPLRNGTTGTTTPSSNGKLYVSTAGSILRYSNALAATGNVAPDVAISGTASQLNAPKRILVDTSTDRLFVANSGGGSVLIFSPASTATAGSSPSAVLTSTGNMTAPFDLAIDPGANLLYVADGDNILVFANESGLSGNVNSPPVRTINFVFAPAGIFLNASTNTMFIADPNDNDVDIMPNASVGSGAGTLLIFGVIGGAATNLSSPQGVVLDSNGNVVVSNNGSTAGIRIFTSLVVSSGGNSDTPPQATISGSSTLVGLPGPMVFNGGANNGELYVVDNQAPGILVFTNVNSLTGNVTSAPTRSIIGSGTQLNANAIDGVALDTTR